MKKLSEEEKKVLREKRLAEVLKPIWEQDKNEIQRINQLLS